MRGVYLLHFDGPYKHARHYLGWAKNIQRRVAEHQAGQGARLTAVAVASGCRLLLARTWARRGRKFERALKGRHNAPRLCPLCKERSKL